MKKIAIISPGRLPVPAVKGGAVENLITYILEGNEKNKTFDIDLYTIYDKDIDVNKYSNTKIISIKNKFIFRVIFKIVNTILGVFSYPRMYNYYGLKLTKVMNKMGNIYDKIIIENNMPLYDEIYNNYKYFNDVDIYFHIHNVIYEDKKMKYLFDIISNTAKKVIAVSKYMENYFKSITDCKNTVVIYNCINFNNYDAKLNLNKIDYRDKLKIKKESYNFIFTGRCVKDKGVLELINAFEMLYRQNKNISLSICGIHIDKPNKFEKKIIKRIEKLSNVKMFSYTNHSNLVKIIASSDCVVIPSICDEAFGVVALEAMAMKKAIISTNSGGLIEPLNDECAIIIERNNIVENLYKAMKKVSENQTLSYALSENAYDRVKNNSMFDNKNYFENFINILN